MPRWSHHRLLRQKSLSRPPWFRRAAENWSCRLLALIVCGILVALGVWLGRRTAPSRALDFQRLTVRHGTVFSARFAPDGHNVVYSASWDGAPIEIFSTDLKIPGLAERRHTREPSTRRFFHRRNGSFAGVHLLSCSPSGNAWTGAVDRRLASPVAEDVEGADWSPDGKSLAIVRDVGGKQRLEYPVGHVLYETDGWMSHMRISPKEIRSRFSTTPPMMTIGAWSPSSTWRASARCFPPVGKVKKDWPGHQTARRCGSPQPKPGCSAGSTPLIWTVTCGRPSGRREE